MPRKKATAAVAVTPPPPPPPVGSKRRLKRELPETEETPVSKVSTLPTRSSKRLRTSPRGATATSPQSTPKKSKYFADSDDEEDEEEEGESEDQDSASGYEDEDAPESQYSGSPSDGDSDDDDEEEDNEDDYDSEEDRKKSKRGRKTKQKGDPVDGVAGKKDLWREGVKTGLGPGKAVYIEKPKARGDGGIKYVPERLHPNTLEFLRDLKTNNDRVWLKAHDADYRQSWKDFESFVDVLTGKIAEVDETIPELPPKDLVFRIYRDVRFSSDQTPYKPHFSAAWSRTGRKGPYACYYVHIQPGGHCYVGSGLWHPEAAPLALLRTDIDQRSERLRAVLMDPSMRKHVFGGLGKDEKKVIRAFCERNKENALKTRPKGYDADHPYIDLLRLRNFTIGQKISDEDILGPRGLDRIIELVKAMHLFVTYLNSVVMPDDGDGDASSSSSSSAEDGDGDGG